MAKTSLPSSTAPGARRASAPSPAPPHRAAPKAADAAGQPADVLASGSLSRARRAGEALPPPMIAHLARSLRPADLAKAFVAQVFDGHERAEIFREHLVGMFPGSAAAIADLSLSATHDYTKMLSLMETGRWPQGSDMRLQRAFAKIMGPLLDVEGERFRAPILLKMGPLAQAVAPGLQKVWGSVAAARLEGTRRLTLRNLGLVERLPDHLWSLTALQDLTLQHLQGAKLPSSIANLSRLQHLQIHEAPNLLTLPDSMAKLTQLKSLRLSGQRFSKRFVLPKFLGSLPNLTSIHVGQLRLERPAWLPPHIAFVRDLDLARPV